jgi:hypothetical protein
MFAWLRMALALTVLVLPGGMVLLLGWALGRAFAARWREISAAHAGYGALLHALAALRFQDVVREARFVSGLPTPSPVPAGR